MKKFKDVKQGDTVSILDPEQCLLENRKVEQVHVDKEGGYVTFNVSGKPRLICLGKPGELIGKVFTIQDGRCLPNLRVLASSIQKIISTGS